MTVPKRRLGKKEQEKQDTLIRRLHREGLTNAQIGIQTRLPPSQVWRILNRGKR